ncbi:hypothetical protein RFI_39674 [Reticulomyxa filosa]|uniref:Uncharacterized protein n=1 Tax=Reticulomyxa filosa TaxID=46433 RepID=X6L7M1_RETFI|nr:hypothetical protein RFI_39674 [Reticulomyxa filosa]|eukprot:ETN97852.1 hypothetical protein RFI_39674 [Reticulomyxa filosa]
MEESHQLISHFVPNQLQVGAEKQEFMIKSIGSLQEGNTKRLFSQFRSMNSNKITVIPAIVSNDQIARTYIEKVELLVSWFDQHPDFSSEIEEYYQLVEDEIASVDEIYSFPNWNEHHQREITEEEALRVGYMPKL